MPAHHPFTMPHPDDLDLLETDPLSVRSQAYDLVLNGWELGLGPRPDPPRRHPAAGLRARSASTDEEAEARFGFLLGAFRYGAPPHAGFAFGIDRLVAIFAGEENIREVIAFPKTQSGADLMTGAPDAASALAASWPSSGIAGARRPERRDGRRDLFDDRRRRERARAGQAPLAARLRPRTLDEVVGQDHLVGPGAPLRALVEPDRLVSLDPVGPGRHRQDDARARCSPRPRPSTSRRCRATSAGVKDVREAIEPARRGASASTARRTMLFIDEVHRFNKSQQDVLLPAVEEGVVVLIGATTENPYFEVNAPLLSRIDAVPAATRSTSDDLARARSRAALQREGVVDRRRRARRCSSPSADGDARGAARRPSRSPPPSPARTTEATTRSSSTETTSCRARDGRVLPPGARRALRPGQRASSSRVRGSDPDAALYWLARMLEAGESPRFVARRLVILASEDIGHGRPARRLVVADAAARGRRVRRAPRGRAQPGPGDVHLALAPKSNRVTDAPRAPRSATCATGRTPRCPRTCAARTTGRGVDSATATATSTRTTTRAGGSTSSTSPTSSSAARYWSPSPHGEEPARDALASRRARGVAADA